MPFAAMPADGPHAPIPGMGGSSTMRVQPDKVLALKRELEGVRDDIRDFLQNKGEQLHVPPMAADPVSGDASKDFTATARTAVRVGWNYVAELSKTIDGLDQAARTYGLVEDTNANALRGQD
jgi:hypothetical protein